MVTACTMVAAAASAVAVLSVYHTMYGQTYIQINSQRIANLPSRDRPNEEDTFPVCLPPGTTSTQAAELTPIFLRQCNEAARHGLPSTAEVRCYGGYLSSLNYERLIPNWVMEMVDHRTLKAGSKSSRSRDSDHGKDEVSREGSHFYADATVPPLFRVGPDGYTTRGLSRGHLAPAQLHKASQPEMNSTFNMNANMVPQDMTLNAVDWLRLEGMTRKISKEVSGPAGTVEGGKVYVVTGPAFMPKLMRVERRADGTELHVPLESTDLLSKGSTRSKTPVNVKPMVSYELTGNIAKGNMVAVPSHLFKVIMAEKQDGTRSIGAFLMKNGPITEQVPLTQYQVPVSAVERLTGLQFFPGLDVAHMADLCKSYTCDAKGSALFQRYRQVAQLRAAETVPELRRRYAALEKEAVDGKVDANLTREFDKRTEELIAESVNSE